MYEVLGDRPSPGTGPHRTMAVAVGLGVLVVLVLGVVTLRGSTDTALSTAAETSDAPALPLLGPGGFGDVRFGQSFADARRALCAGTCDDGQQVIQLASDEAHGCQLRVREGAVAAARPTTWVWVRDDRVVAVGVSDTTGAARVPTWPGIALGDGLARDDRELAGWSWDATAPVVLARDSSAGFVTRLADTDADGLVDYATVATEDGDVCEVEPAPAVTPAPPTAAIDGSTLLGLPLAAPKDVAMASPGWQWDGVTVGGCRRLVAADGAAVAFVRDAVIGLSAPAVVGGPTVGQSLRGALSGVRITDRPSGDIDLLVRGGVVTAQGIDGEGRQLTLRARPYPRYVAFLDLPVYVPDTAQVTAITVGEDCRGPS